MWYHLNHCTRTVPGVGERREVEDSNHLDRSSSEEEIGLHGGSSEEEEQSQIRTEEVENGEGGSVHELADDANVQPGPVSQGTEGGEREAGASFPTWDLETISLRDFLDQ